MARFVLAKFGSQINGVVFSEAACKISAQLDLFGLVIANFKLGLVWLRFGLARFGLSKFGSQINWIGSSEAAFKISAQLDFIWLRYS